MALTGLPGDRVPRSAGPSAQPWWEIAAAPRPPAPARLSASGFKHLLVPLLAASCLSDGRWDIHNVPDIADLHVLGDILAGFDVDVDIDVDLDRATRSVAIRAMGLVGTDIPAELSSLVHGATYLLPVLLARHGSVRSGRHGGCSIGAGTGGRRPMEHIAAVLRRFGARCTSDGDGFQACAPAGLRGTTIDLADFAVVEPTSGTLTGPHYSGATKTALLAAAAARGTTVLRHPYPKPDATGLARALQAASVPVDIQPGQIVVEGRGGPVGSAAFVLPSDLIEVVTYTAAAVHLGCAVEIGVTDAPAVRAGLKAEIDHLEAMGVPIQWRPGTIEVGPAEQLRPAHVIAASHLVYSDCQPLFALMLLGAQGPSTIVDEVWSSRFGYVEGLRRLGGRFDVGRNHIVVHPGSLRPYDGPLAAADLRSAATLVLAAVGAGGRHRVHGVQHLARGYSAFRAALAELGGRVVDEYP